MGGPTKGQRGTSAAQTAPGPRQALALASAKKKAKIEEEEVQATPKSDNVGEQSGAKEVVPALPSEGRHKIRLTPAKDPPANSAGKEAGAILLFSRSAIRRV